MWVLSKADGSFEWRLRCGAEYAVGRKEGECDLLIVGDKSISRCHAVVRVAGHKCSADPAARPEVVVSDRKSTYGTHVGGQQLSAGADRVLSEGDSVKFGYFASIFSLRWEPISVVCTNTTADTKGLLRTALDRVGGCVTTEQSLATHCVTDEVRPSTVILRCLAQALPLIRVSWVTELAAQQAPRAPPPELGPHAAPIGSARWHTHLPDQAAGSFDPQVFQPNELRKELFRGISVVFLDADAWVQGHDAVEAAGGKALDCSTVDWTDPGARQGFLIRHRGHGVALIASDKNAAGSAAAAAARAIGFTVGAVGTITQALLRVEASALRPPPPPPGPLKAAEAPRAPGLLCTAPPPSPPPAPEAPAPAPGAEQPAAEPPQPQQQQQQQPKATGFRFTDLLPPEDGAPSRGPVLPHRRSQVLPSAKPSVAVPTFLRSDAPTSNNTFLTLGDGGQRQAQSPAPGGLQDTPLRVSPPPPRPGGESPPPGAAEAEKVAPLLLVTRELVCTPLALPDWPCYTGGDSAGATGGNVKLFAKQQLPAPPPGDTPGQFVPLVLSENPTSASRQVLGSADPQPGGLAELMDLKPQKILKRMQRAPDIPAVMAAPAVKRARGSGSKRGAAGRPDHGTQTSVPLSMQAAAGLLRPVDRSRYRPLGGADEDDEFGLDP
eukprot:TRINITY_DN9431_c1_g2_i1.p1 TRINITY_DN9431_c1_g2~~TRINITY_DN9431_c1_g2_i1.p1  ORF type:complete len:664 (+),score=154.46 TRINITY_DN9431_c1_g2_i1:112-2103(+)